MLHITPNGNSTYGESHATTLQLRLRDTCVCSSDALVAGRRSAGNLVIAGSCDTVGCPISFRYKLSACVLVVLYSTLLVCVPFAVSRATFGLCVVNRPFVFEICIQDLNRFD